MYLQILFVQLFYYKFFVRKDIKTWNIVIILTRMQLDKSPLSFKCVTEYNSMKSILIKSILKSKFFIFHISDKFSLIRNSITIFFYGPVKLK